MVSIIISSANNEYLTNVSANIEATIGVPYEIIATNNGKGEKGICQVYNDGAKKAKFEILCFMHEDLKILTDNWGFKVFEKFSNDSQLGIIGVVGSAYKPLAPSGWGAAGTNNSVLYSNYVQHYKHENKPSHLINFNPTDKNINEVACVDGMWFCTTKSIVESFPFDDVLLKGFHCYDIDFCLNVGRTYKVVVVFDILMEHFSEGSYSKSWLDDTIKLHDKWKDILPVAKGEISNSERKNMEKRAYKMLFERFKKMGYNYSYGLSILKGFFVNRNIDFKLYLKLNYYLFKYYFI